MNKQDMVDTLAERFDLSKARAGEIVDTIFAPNGLIATELRNGNKVQIAGFGNFEARTRAARQARNPQTGEMMSIGASTVPAFRAGKALKDVVNQRS